jgi:hypothetical protein
MGHCQARARRAGTGPNMSGWVSRVEVSTALHAEQALLYAHAEVRMGQHDMGCKSGCSGPVVWKQWPLSSSSVPLTTDASSHWLETHCNSGWRVTTQGVRVYVCPGHHGHCRAKVVGRVHANCVPSGYPQAFLATHSQVASPVRPETLLVAPPVVPTPCMRQANDCSATLARALAACRPRSRATCRGQAGVQGAGGRGQRGAGGAGAGGQHAGRVSTSSRVRRRSCMHEPSAARMT